MEETKKFLLPAPNFGKKEAQKQQLHYLTPSGMTLLPRERQPPPMYGSKGSTIPAKFLQTGNNEKSIEEPPPKRQFCEACEMELQSPEDFRRHRSQHERCPVDSCKYKGHPSVMDKHVIELHNSGVFDKIKKLITPEEIAAWREERRKKYPTLANAKMRQLAEEQKQRRGERIQENKARFGRPEDRKRARNGNKREEQRNDKRSIEPKKFRNNETNNKKGKYIRLNERVLKNPEEKTKTVVKSEKADAVKTENKEDIVSCGIKMFRGTSKMQGYKHGKPKLKKEKHVLLSLVGMYGSDDSESGSESDNMEHENNLEKTEISMEEPKETSCKEAAYIPNENPMVEDPITTIPETDTLSQSDTEKPINHKITCCDSNPQSILKGDTSVEEKTANIENNVGLTENTKSLHESSDEAPEEMPIQRKTAIEVEVDPPTPDLSLNSSPPESIEAKRLRILQSRKQLQEQRKSLLNIRNKKLRRQNTMLEKLLEPEIRHERNVLLQCVRYVCENNFFGIGNEPISN